MIRAEAGRPRRSTASRLGSTVLMLVTAAATLAACGTPLIPSIEPSATPTSSPSASPTPTPSSVPSPSSTTEPDSPDASGSPSEPGAGVACTTDQLTFALQSRPMDSGMGSFFWDLSITNSGALACTADGYPSVLLVSADTGRPIGAASGLEARAQPSPVLLQPGESAYSLLHMSQAGAYGCALVPVTELAVTPPNTSQPSRVTTPNTIDGCNDPSIQLVRTGAFADAPVAF